MTTTIHNRWPAAFLFAKALLCGGLHALAFAPDPLPSWALPYIQIFLLAWVFKQAITLNIRQAMQLGWSFGLGQFALGLYWLYISMNSYGGLAAPLAAAGVLALASFLAVYPMLALLWVAWSSQLLQQSRRWPRQLLVACSWASAWALSEWLRGTLLTGFPWLNIGYAHTEGVLAPWATLFGVVGVSWLASFAAATIALFITHKDGIYDAHAAVSLGVTIVIGLIGIGLNHVAWTSNSGDPLVVRLVQGNIEQSEKFDEQHLEHGLQTYLELAELPAKDPNGVPDLIVLPETVIPLFQDVVSPNLWRRWQAVSQTFDATVLMGIPLRDDAGSHHTNSAITFTHDTPIEKLHMGNPDTRYDKHHLVPFGEFIPPGFGWFVRAMEIPLGNFDAGPVRQSLLSLHDQTISPNICYEDLFGAEIRTHVQEHPKHGPGATILINISNLAWFGDTWALRQHLQIARMRVLETRRPMLRATNTGLTAAIAPDGQVAAALKTAQPGVLDVSIQGTTGLTPYVRWGNMPVLIWILIIMSVTGLRRRVSN